MTFSASLLRKAALLAAFALVAGVWSTTALAQVETYPVTGNARYQIGDGLPIPIGFTPAPVGKVKILPGATIQQTTGVDPKKMYMPTSGASHPGGPQVIGVYGANSQLFQVYTNVPLAGPKNPVTFSAGGRTGAATVNFCPGYTAYITGAPGTGGCTAANKGNPIAGLMIYRAIGNQFGGVNQGNVGGIANVALRVPQTPNNVPQTSNGIPTGTVTAVFGIANPAPTGGQGAAFGFFNSTAGAAPAAPNGIGRFFAKANGTLVGAPVWQDPTNPGSPNPVTEYGGPWTTGQLVVSMTNAKPPEKFTFTGADNRVNGVGTISLITGSLSARTLSEPNANRGWLNLTVHPKWLAGPIPALSRGGLAAAFGLLALAGGYLLHRKGRS